MYVWFAAAVVISIHAAPQARAEGDAFADLARLIDPAPTDATPADPPHPSAPPAGPILADNLLTGPTSREAATRPVDQPDNGFQRTLAELIGHFAPYEPVYFVAGPQSTPSSASSSASSTACSTPPPRVGKLPVVGQLDFAYTQLSLWALTAAQRPLPTTPTTSPSSFFNDDDVQLGPPAPASSSWAFLAGFGHDSNGQRRHGQPPAEPAVRPAPTFNFGDPEQLPRLRLSPRPTSTSAT